LLGLINILQKIRLKRRRGSKGIAKKSLPMRRGWRRIIMKRPRGLNSRAPLLAVVQAALMNTVRRGRMGRSPRAPICTIFGDMGFV
jgi:hypothetical protein